MDEEIKYEATVVVQEHELGLGYLLQIDSKHGRMFIDIDGLILSLKDGSFPHKPGEYFLHSTLDEDEQQLNKGIEK